MNLFLVECRRMAARRFTRYGALPLLVALLAALALTAAFSTSEPTAENRADARAEHSRYLTDARAEQRTCEQAQAAGNTTTYPADFRCADFATGVPSEQDILTSYVYTFSFADEMRDRSVFLVVVLVLFALLLGATLSGSEWQHGTVAALLLYEPRRARVFAAKAGAVAAGLTALTGLLYAAHVGGHYLVALARGQVATLTRDMPPDLAPVMLRGWALVVAAGLIGFALAFTLRRTAGALGVLLGYAAVFEFGLLIFSDFSAGLARLRVGLLSTLMTAWLVDGATVPLPPSCPPNGECQEPIMLTVSMWQGGLALAGLAATLLVVSAVIFRRREVT